jgi:hypothetical protein
MVQDSVTEMFDKKINSLAYRFDPNSQGQKEMLKLDKQLYQLTNDFTLYDWSKVQSKEFIENRDTIQGVTSFDRDYKKKQYLLTRVEKYLEWKANNK